MATGQETPLNDVVLPASGKSIPFFLTVSCLDLILLIEMLFFLYASGEPLFQLLDGGPVSWYQW